MVYTSISPSPKCDRNSEVTTWICSIMVKISMSSSDLFCYVIDELYSTFGILNSAIFIIVFLSNINSYITHPICIINRNDCPFRTQTVSPRHQRHESFPVIVCHSPWYTCRICPDRFSSWTAQRLVLYSCPDNCHMPVNTRPSTHPCRRGKPGRPAPLGGTRPGALGPGRSAT